HPLHWLIALDIQHSQLSFFEMDENVDTGKVLLQVPFEIFRSDTIADAVKKMNLAGYLGTKMLYERLKKNPALVGKTQDHSQGNVWRKRTPHDVTLDLRLSTDLIIRIVRSFAPPYPCANLIYKKDIIKISDAVVAKQNIAIEDVHRLEPGNILHIEKKAITIKAANEAITLISKDELPESILSAKYIHPPSYYMQKWPEVLTALQ
ncbi:uncharacterized protein METZ01_LOCUS418881, partial [marine metagenome]